MKKPLLIFLLLISILSLNSQTSTPPAGSGWSGDPYQIATLENLYWLTQTSSAWSSGNYFIQTADIDASATSSWDSGKGFSPIGTSSSQFKGNYNGQEYTISNITINDPSNGWYVGMFGYIADANIENLNIYNADITGYYYAGVLAANSTNSTITNCNVSGEITLGGSYAGGLIGDDSYGELSYCSADVDITGYNILGGLVALSVSATVDNCFAIGDISCTNTNEFSYLGGLLGANQSTVSNCYALGNVTGVGYVGGFSGEEQNSAVENCYATGTVTGTESTVGGFYGYSYNNTSSDCFWDTQTSGTTTGVGSGSSTGVTGKTTSEMQTQSTYDPPWDFTNTWGITSGNYPTLLPMPDCTNPTSGGTIAQSQSVCSGSSPAPLTSTQLPSGHTGDLEYKWQSSTTSSSTGFTDISSSNSSGYSPGSIAQTTWYKRLARVDCMSDWTGAVSSNVLQLTYYPDAFDAGEIATAGETICYNGEPMQIGSTEDASGGDGNITYKWQKSTDDAFTSPIDIDNSDAATYNPPSGLTTTTWYRRMAKDGVCNTTFSASTGTWKVTVRDEFDAGEIASTGETICYSGDPSQIGSTEDASGGDGNITYKWQTSSDDSFTSPADIDNSNSATYDPPSGLTSTTWYRRLAKDGTCNTSFSTSTGTWKVTVNDEFDAGEIESTGESICYGGNPVQIGNTSTANGGDGSITYKWQRSNDMAFSGPEDIDNSNTSAYDPPNGIVSTTWYRRLAKDGTCNTNFTASTGIWKVTVFDEFVVGSITEDQSFCVSGTPEELVGIAPTGGNIPYSYQWQSSDNGVDFDDITGANELNYQPDELSETTYYRLKQTSSSGCGELTTNMVTITVHNLCCDPNINTCQSPDPIAQNNEAFVSDVESGLKIYDNFSGIVGGITGIEWWGTTVDGDNYCNENPKSFTISFYRDNAGSVGEMYKSYQVSITGVETGSVFGTNNLPIMSYTYTLSQPFSGLSSGWVSIQGNPAGTCEFSWLTSPYGDGKSFVDGRSQLTDDFAFGIENDPSIPISDWSVYLIVLTIGATLVYNFRRFLLKV